MGKSNDKIIIGVVVSVTVLVLAATGYIIFSKGVEKKKELKKKSDDTRQSVLKSGGTKLDAEKQATLALVSVPEKAKVEKEIAKITAGKSEEQAVKAIQEYQKKVEQESSGFLATIETGVSAVVDKVLNYAQEQEIKKLAPPVQQKFRSLVTAIENKGYRVWINPQSIVRTFMGGGINSAHTYGLAIDINMSKDGKDYKMDTPYKEWEATGVPALAKSMGFRWGGDFTTYIPHGKPKTWTNRDTVHFDLKSQYDTAVLSVKAKAKYGDLSKSNKTGVEFV